MYKNTAMTSTKPKPKNIAEYIASAPKESQKKLREMYVCLKDAAPKAETGLKWGMPALSHKRILVMFAGFPHHIGFYPTPSAIKAFKKELAKYKHAKGSVQFPLEKPLPLPLIRKMTAFRIKEAVLQDGKWRSGTR
ncbi:MAG: hypothetical protein RL681_746 [Candidatus Parcubacteria bacterium]|jgi:uncharacterized protein YdhG (YjbR/CyaY superfamily)